MLQSLWYWVVEQLCQPKCLIGANIISVFSVRATIEWLANKNLVYKLLRAFNN